MRVFVLPTWHPTPQKPHYCKWILPHIAMLRQAGFDCVVLQLGFGDAPQGQWDSKPRLLDDRHLYAPVPAPVHRYERTRLRFGWWLRAYTTRIETLFDDAVSRWGKPDVIHAHVSLPGGYVAAALGRKHGIPVIVQEHYSGFESDTRFPWRVGSHIREMGRSIAGFYAVSAGFAHRVAATGVVEVSGVLPNPVDTDFFSPRDECRGPVDPSPSLRIVTTGGLHSCKGTDLLLDAVRRLSSKLDVQLQIFGDQSNKAPFKKWLDDQILAPRITLEGTVDHSTLRQAYRESHLFVVSSRIETANVSMLEAMACGTLVVTTVCGAPETLLEGSDAIVVAPNDSQALANGITTALRTTCVQEQGQAFARHEFVRRQYSTKSVVNDVQRAYLRAVARQG